ncbi:HD domain-containing protein [Phascolarctobacterium sp.]|uniref:HD domain-containing protein n=1 Tax=Phascolarctobacterium sp. TaxID=2049039 RepID=UPI003866B517
MIQKILAKMIEYDANDPRRIHHFLKVYGFAHLIGELEGLAKDELFTLDIAAILHDIGIHLAEAKYGSSNGKYQEELGPDEARKLLSEFALSDEVVERVCFLIAHHHTYSDVDGLDYQILLEADFLVNAYEDDLSTDAIASFREKVFRTKTGIKILNTMFGL